MEIKRNEQHIIQWICKETKLNTLTPYLYLAHEFEQYMVCSNNPS